MKELVAIIRRGAAWILLCPMVGGLLGLGLAQITPPSYVATSAAYVHVEVPPEDGVTGYTSAAQLAQNTTNSFLPVITSRSVAQGVIDQLGLEASPEDVSSWISASRITESQTIEITVTAPSSEVAVQVADAVVAQSSDKIRNLEGETYPVSLALLTSAELSPVTKTPSLVRYISAGAVGGLLVGMGIVFAISVLDPQPVPPPRVETGQMGRVSAAPPPAR